MKTKLENFHFISFPLAKKEDWRDVLPRKLNKLQSGMVVVDCLDWTLGCREFQQIKAIFDRAGLQIKLIQSSIPETIVSASSLGHPTLLKIKGNEAIQPTEYTDLKGDKTPCILFHEGTLRSGETLEADGDLLVLGDVNPGAKVSAGGDVMILGRLRGIAHAGISGNNQAKILALQLKPLQLRIADKLARGPEEMPEEGLAEEAFIESGQIVIKPAKPNSLRNNQHKNLS